MELKYNIFAVRWVDGIPIGNGRLAAMVWGDNKKDIISLNHEWIWTGEFKERENEKNAHFLPYVREFLKKEQYFQATALAALAFGGNGGISPLKRRMDSYQPVGDLIFEHEISKNIERDLSITSGIITSNKLINNNTIKLTSYCDVIEDVFVARWESDNKFNGNLYFTREEDSRVETSTQVYEHLIEFNCQSYKGISFNAMLKINTDGKSKIINNKIQITNATYLQIIGNVGTSKKGIDKELKNFKNYQYDYNSQIIKHKNLFDSEVSRLLIKIENDDYSNLRNLSINERVKRIKETGESDPELTAILANFGIYLMVSGSFLGDLPLHLQGKWNHDINPKWNSDYHLNINLQMNYWFTDKLNMQEYSKKMLEYVFSLIPKAQKAAKDVYGCSGVLYPLNSDIWGNCTAESYNYSVWISSAGWLSQHIWNYYQYTGDMEFLKTRAYPFIKEVATFYTDYIVFDDDGTAQIMPSQSPENRFVGTGYFPVSMCTSSAMDVQIAYDSLTYAIDSALLLNIDNKLVKEWKHIRNSLPDFRIGKDGRLLEWDSDNKIEAEKGHRHLSHLYGVYPSNLFNPLKNKQVFEAARKSLDFRMEHGGGHVGWSRSWSACLFARFGDAKMVNEHLSQLISGLTSPTLLALHPDYHPANTKKSTDTPLLFTKPAVDPQMIFQIDGNLGATAAVLESLVQQHEDRVFLLRALPNEWKNGAIQNIRLFGGHKLFFKWENHKISYLKIEKGYRDCIILDNVNNSLDIFTTKKEIFVDFSQDNIFTLEI